MLLNIYENEIRKPFLLENVRLCKMDAIRMGMGRILNRELWNTETKLQIDIKDNGMGYKDPVMGVWFVANSGRVIKYFRVVSY